MSVLGVSGFASRTHFYRTVRSVCTPAHMWGGGGCHFGDNCELERSSGMQPPGMAVGCCELRLRSTPRYRLVCICFPTPGRGLPYGSGLGLSRCLGPGECLHSFILACSCWIHLHRPRACARQCGTWFALGMVYVTFERVLLLSISIWGGGRQVSNYRCQTANSAAGQ